MRSKFEFSIPIAIAVGALAGCGDPTPHLQSRQDGRSATKSARSLAPLTLHVIDPRTTDRAIDSAPGDEHYVWFNPAFHGRRQLFVMMPGTKQQPAMFQLVTKEAARLGYHAIALMYQDSVRVNAACRAVADTASCLENTRLAILDGNHLSPVVTVTPANGIDNRLIKLLQYLDQTYPEEEWSDFLDDGRPVWKRIVVAGHSQGGGQAAMIAKLRAVARVVLFSSPGDAIAGHAPQDPWHAAPWLSAHVTPSNRYFGLAHHEDTTAPYTSILITWEALGLTAFGPLVPPESSAPPYGETHTLVTDITPVGGFVNAHGAPSNDFNTPLRSDGTPELLDAWRYLLTAPTDDDGSDDEEEIGSNADDSHPAIRR